MITKNIKAAAFWVVLTILFMLIIGGERGLYSGAQEYHFISGLADTGRGELSSDWFTQTKTPWVLFEILVEFTVRYLGEPFFYVYQFVLYLIYLYSLVGIADHFFNIRRDRLVFFIFLSIFLSSHAVFWPGNLGYVLYSGVATQSVPFSAFVPNHFGAFLFFSVYAFFKQKPSISLLSMTIACSFHPSYLIVGATLVSSYLLIMYLEGRDVKKLIRFGGSAFLLVLPIVVYFYTINLGVSAENVKESLDIIAGNKLTHHTQVRVWWDEYVFIRLLIVMAALVTVRKNRLFLILGVGLLFVALPTAFLYFRPSNILGALMLWRPAVVVVPLSTTALIASWASGSYARNEPEIKAHWQWVVLVLLSLLVVMLYVGIKQQIWNIELVENRQSNPLFQYVREDLQPGDQYLLPPSDSGVTAFRLETGAPVFVDWNLHPWGAEDSLEWYRRYKIMQDFYALDGTGRCSMAPELVRRYGITHIVLPTTLNMKCPEWKKVFLSAEYQVYSMAGE